MATAVVQDRLTMRCLCLLLLGLLAPLINMEFCGHGFIITDIGCIDDDECSPDGSICGSNATCINTPGSYYCQCVRGYQKLSGKLKFTIGDVTKCEDINECNDKEICGPNSDCTNTLGSFECRCKNSYVLSNGTETFSGGNVFKGVQCQDGGLDYEGACEIAAGNYRCMCPEGFTNYGIPGVRCTELKCDAFLNESSTMQTTQVPVEMEETLAKLSSTCMALHKREPVKNGSTEPVHEETLLEMLLHAIDMVLISGSLNDRTLTAMLDILEPALKLLGHLQKGPISKSSAHTQMEVLVRRGKDEPKGSFALSTTGTKLESDWTTATGDSYLGFATVSLLSYNSLHKLVNSWIEPQEAEFILNSRVVTAVVTNPHTEHLMKPIILTFSHLQVLVGKQTCVFWDSKLKGGAWSVSGCTVIRFSNTHTRAVNQMVSGVHQYQAALLEHLKHIVSDNFELQLITWVGLSLSLVCLFISMLTFGFIRSIQNTRTTIHLHLCISLFIADFIFLVGIAQTKNEVGCAFVAGLLHFFFLAAFCWMCLEGVQLFRMVVLVFHTTLKPLYLMAAGYGVPAAIVAVSAAVNAKGYGTRRYCWLDLERGFIWSFFGPVCVIIVVNIFFFLITVWKLLEKFSSLSQDLSNLHKIKTFMITAIAQLCILGTTWIFGCFQFSKGTLAMSFLFTIFNSLQGVLVFTMHCLLCKQVRDEYVKILTRMCAPHMKKYSEFSTNPSSKSQVSGTVQHTGESHI